MPSVIGGTTALLRARPAVAAMLLAVLVGLSTLIHPLFAMAVGAALATCYMVLRVDLVGELTVGAFWIVFGIYQTALMEAGTQVPGIFYPFYGLMLINLAFTLQRGRVRIERWSGWYYAAFMILVLASFIGMTRPVDFFVVQRVASYAFGLLVLFQVGSKRGLGPIFTAAVLCGVSVSVWVIVRAIEGGFDYRADIEVDQNFTAFVVGLGMVVSMTVVLWRLVNRSEGSAWITTLSWLSMGVMFYATLLLASRGMIIALGVATLALLVRMTVLSRRTFVIFLLVAAIAGASFLLPGSSGLLERFRGDSVETGGGRIPVWRITAEAYMDGSPPRLIFGNGFKSSEPIVERRFAFTSVHNAYLQILYEFGLLGLALFLLFHTRLIFLAWGLRTEATTIAYTLTWYLLGANLSADTPDGFMYWTALGLVAAAVVWNSPAMKVERVMSD